MTPDTTAELQPVAPATSTSIIADALARNVAPETLRELLAVRREWEADEARKAYFLAVSSFQRRCPIVEKGDKAHDKDYARLDRIWRTIRPLLTELGLAVTWQTCEQRPDGICRVEGTLSHQLGHSTRILQDVPLPDLIRGQNKAQQMGSASTYARRYALCSALGIVTGQDDDGGGAGGNYLTDAEVAEVTRLLDRCRQLPDFNENKFWLWAGALVVQEIDRTRYAEIVRMLTSKSTPKESQP